MSWAGLAAQLITVSPMTRRPTHRRATPSNSRSTTAAHPGWI